MNKMASATPRLRQDEVLERSLGDLLSLSDEAGLDGRWSHAFGDIAAYVQRPGKRFRPALVVAGYAVAKPGHAVPKEVSDFAASLELLHSFMLVHDDVADRASTRRGGPALQHVLSTPFGNTSEATRLGENLAIIAGDHLFARAIEGMLSCALPSAAAATRYMLSVCRHTAAGQYLDVTLATTPLSELTLFQTLRVAHLKTARYGFVAPLVAGAMLGGADSATLDALTRVGRHAGLAFQLRDDLMGLFGDAGLTGKSGVADYQEGKRTFPVVAAYIRADAAGRERLEALWNAGSKVPALCAQAPVEVERYGGKAATERAIERSERAADKALISLPLTPGRETLRDILARLSRRTS